MSVLTALSKEYISVIWTSQEDFKEEAGGQVRLGR